MIIGLDGGSRTVAEAERLLHETEKALGLPAGTVGCTHFVRVADGTPHVACSLSLARTIDPAALAALFTPPGLPALAALPAGVGIASGDDRAGPEELARGAALAAAEHAAGTAGRLVVYPGRAELTGTLSVAEILARSAIDQVAVLAQAEEPPPDTLVTTNDHVRPQLRDGRVVLLTMPALNGRLMPAEVPDPTPCCADHG